MRIDAKLLRLRYSALLLNLVTTFRQLLAMSRVTAGATGLYALQGARHSVGVSRSGRIRQLLGYSLGRLRHCHSVVRVGFREVGLDVLENFRERRRVFGHIRVSFGFHFLPKLPDRSAGLLHPSYKLLIVGHRYGSE